MLVQENLARCSCGSVSVRVTGAPAFSAVCNCRDCRSRTGSAFGMGVYYQKSSVMEIIGQPTVYRRHSNGGRTLDFYFCGACGSTVWWELEMDPNLIAIAAGLMDDDFLFEPDRAVFCESKYDFVSFKPGVDTYQRASWDG